MHAMGKGLALGPPLRGIGKIIGVGLNYRDHAEETGLALPKEPTLFLKGERIIVHHSLIPAQAGIQGDSAFLFWVPAFAGTSGETSAPLLVVNLREEVILP